MATHSKGTANNMWTEESVSVRLYHEVLNNLCY